MIEYPKYKKVLFCTDFSKNADCAFSYAFGIAKRDDAVLYILHVIPRNIKQDSVLRSYVTNEQWNKIQEDAQKDLERQCNDQYVCQIMDKSKVKFVTKSGFVDEEILKFAVQEEIDLITMGSRGEMGSKYGILGSEAERVVRHSSIPVFIIPCKG